MSKLRFICWSFVPGLAFSLLLARVHPFGDARLNATTSAADLVPTSIGIPAPVGSLLNEKCVDCHSSQTRPPLYAHVAPVSWLLERDIIAARKELNLSNWTSYTPEQQDTLKSKILQQTRAGHMPPLQYRLIHWSTRITDTDIQLLTGWAHATTATDGAAAAVAGDPGRGQSVFERRCTGCHSLTSDREGPRLQGVVGRPAASIPGFQYSAALRQKKIVWNEETLDRWLTDPDSFIPNSNMDFRVPKSQERKDLIAYLSTTRAER